jgi:thiol-disulfide isomerase/thioredoxin
MNAHKLMAVVAGAVLAGSIAIVAPAFAADAAPAFTLQDTQGKTVSLASLRGKVVFIDFWASWCPPCRRSIPMVEEVYQKYKGTDAVFLGINVENDLKTAANYAKKANIGYQVLVGSDDVSRAYRVSGIPAFYIIGKDGALLQKYEGYYPGMEKEWQKVIDQALKATGVVAKPAGKQAPKKTK